MELSDIMVECDPTEVFCRSRHWETGGNRKLCENVGAGGGLAGDRVGESQPDADGGAYRSDLEKLHDTYNNNNNNKNDDYYLFF